MEHLPLYDNVALRPISISIVSEYRMSNIGAVNADLVRPPRLDSYPKERCLVAKMLDDLEVSRGRSTRTVSLSKKEPSGMNCPNWHVDSATLLRKCPPNQGKILFLRVMVAELSLEAAPPGLRTGQDHHAARVLVEPMYNPGQLDTLSLI
jgi:hypothetical protein